MQASLQYAEFFLEGLPQTMQASIDFAAVAAGTAAEVVGGYSCKDVEETDLLALPELSVEALDAFLILLAAALGLLRDGSWNVRLEHFFRQLHKL